MNQNFDAAVKKKSTLNDRKKKKRPTDQNYKFVSSHSCQL